ncbi:YidH family protein [Streptomyces sp. NPDC059717]|uniref:YidH family protein n=1 Tax=Streptomyces sp. NPDC059717 TaxID=3346922 RepID=UPI0036CE666B
MNPDTSKGPSPNAGSRAREHLANERTYLAWLRTGISVAALGVAVAKFAPTEESTPSPPVASSSSPGSSSAGTAHIGTDLSRNNSMLASTRLHDSASSRLPP